MIPPREETLLLGALLDRLGNTQAQALLKRLDQWLFRNHREAPSENNRFDRRRHIENAIQNLDTKAASWTPKDSNL
jgi:hypothetical protein